MKSETPPPVDPTTNERFAIFSDDDRLFLKDFFVRHPDVGENFQRFLGIPPKLRIDFAKNTARDMPRRGWVKRGVNEKESVYDHSIGLAYFAEFAFKKLLRDAGRFDENQIDAAGSHLRQMGKLHDIMVEAIATDYTPGEIPESDKSRVELLAAKVILEAYPEHYALVEEFIRQETFASQILHDFDKIHAVMKAASIEVREPEKKGIFNEFLVHAKEKMKTPMGKSFLEGFENDQENFRKFIASNPPGAYFGL